MLISQHDLKKLCHSLSLANRLSRTSCAGGLSSLGRLLSVSSVCCARVSEDSFTGLADARASLLRAFVIVLSICCLRASSQGVLSFKRGYSVPHVISKT